LNQTITYTNPHSSFKLEGVFYDKTGLSYLAERLMSEGESYQVSLGHFILQWIDLSPEINLQTSGSTGTPKTILMSKQAMVNSAIATGNYFKLKPGDSALSCLPFEYIAAKMMFVRAYVLGLEMDCVNPSSKPLKALKRSYDFCAMVPLQLENSIEYLHHIKTIIVGGAKVSKGLISKLVNSASAIYETFGMTETLSHIAVKNISISKDVFEVLPSVSIGVDTRNCLFIKAPHIVSTLIQTNDVVNLTSKTTFEWIGRYDTIINSGGIKIAPEQLEHQLEGFIKERFFIASQKNNSLGEIVIIVIERSIPYKNLSFDALEPIKRPKHTYYVDAIKETVSGKIKRQETLDLVTLE
jgi:O-succinylbenzoic acid--CoA ligase